MLKEFHEQKTKYATAKATRLGKGTSTTILSHISSFVFIFNCYCILSGSDREAETLLHLQKFKKMLTEKRSLAPAVESDEDSADTGSSWLVDS